MRPMRRRPGKRRGVVMLAVLVVVAMLALTAYTFSNFVTVENDLSAIEVRRTQARLNADSAAAAIAAMLKGQAQGQATPDLVDNPDMFRGFRTRPESPLAQSVASDELPRDIGRAAIFVPIWNLGMAGSAPSAPSRSPVAATAAPVDAASGLSPSGSTLEPPIRFGVERESGRIHLMRWLAADPEALRRALLTLPHANEALVDATLDWLDADDIARPAGAERRDYENRPLPVQPRNGAIDDLDELLSVRGMTREIWFGSRDGREPGWRQFLTVKSREPNRDRLGRPRVWINDPNVASLVESLTKEFDEPLARFVAAFRTPSSTSQPGRVFGSVWELVDAVAIIDGKAVESPLRSTDPNLGERLSDALDRLTTTDAKEFVGRVDLQSAGPAALELLPLTPAQRQSILEHRTSLQTATGSGERQLGGKSIRPAETLSWLLTERILTVPEIIAIEPMTTACSPVVRFETVGFFEEGRDAVRVEYLLDSSADHPRILQRKPHGPFGIGISLATLGQGSPPAQLLEQKTAGQP